MDPTSKAPVVFGDAELFRLTRDTTWWCEPVAEDYNDIRPHLLMLYSLAKWVNWPDPRDPGPVKPPLCVEIGTRHGISTLAILKAMSETGGKLLSVEIDPYWAGIATERIETAGLCKWWQMNVANSNDFAAECPDGIDLLWIDGDHTYEQVLRDMENYIPKVRAGGVICMHDFFQDIGATVPGDVSLAIRAYVATNGYRFEGITLPYSYGFTILKKL